MIVGAQFRGWGSVTHNPGRGAAIVPITFRSHSWHHHIASSSLSRRARESCTTKSQLSGRGRSHVGLGMRRSERAPASRKARARHSDTGALGTRDRPSASTMPDPMRASRAYVSAESPASVVDPRDWLRLLGPRSLAAAAYHDARGADRNSQAPRPSSGQARCRTRRSDRRSCDDI
jgi:hypothetical protein